jgi:decaprenyl-phosphate phosphoribosyltransferase
MKVIKSYIKLARLKHSVKNLLIFLPLVSSGKFFQSGSLADTVMAFIVFSLAASAIYVINDIRDKDLDKEHPRKKKRPIAAGIISARSGLIFAVLLLGVSLGLHALAGLSLGSFVLLLSYVAINFLYSLWFKNVPIIDIGIIAIGFILRVFYGGEVIGVEISQWLAMVILAFSLYLGLGKRLGEIKTGSAHTRKVNQYYTREFLDKNMFVFLALTIVFYALWTVEVSTSHQYIFWTLPLVIVIMIVYTFDVEKPGVEADPSSVLFSNKILMLLVVTYVLSIIGIIYI